MSTRSHQSSGVRRSTFIQSIDFRFQPSDFRCSDCPFLISSATRTPAQLCDGVTANDVRAAPTHVTARHPSPVRRGPIRSASGGRLREGRLAPDDRARQLGEPRQHTIAVRRACNPSGRYDTLSGDAAPLRSRFVPELAITRRPVCSSVVVHPLRSTASMHRQGPRSATTPRGPVRPAGRYVVDDRRALRTAARTTRLCRVNRTGILRRPPARGSPAGARGLLGARRLAQAGGFSPHR